MGIISHQRDTADTWYIYGMLFYSSIAYSGNLVFDLFHLRPTDDAAYKSVSSFYGPGVYLAWWLTASSVLMKCTVEEPVGGITGSEPDSSNQDSPDLNAPNQCAPGQDSGLQYGVDLMSTIYYIAAVAIWSIYQVFHKNHAELAAGLVVLEAGADFCMMHILISKTATSARIIALGLFLYSTQTHQAFIFPNHSLAAGVNACVSLCFALLWIYDKRQLKSIPRRWLMALPFGVLWIFNFADFGTYATMPRTEIDFINLDQLAPFIGAILLIIWSWRTELKTFSIGAVHFLRKSLGQLGQTLQAWNPSLDGLLRKTSNQIRQTFQRDNDPGTL